MLVHDHLTNKKTHKKTSIFLQTKCDWFQITVKLCIIQANFHGYGDWKSDLMFHDNSNTFLFLRWQWFFPYSLIAHSPWLLEEKHTSIQIFHFVADNVEVCTKSIRLLSAKEKHLMKKNACLEKSSLSIIFNVYLLLGFLQGSHGIFDRHSPVSHTICSNLEVYRFIENWIKSSN